MPEYRAQFPSAFESVGKARRAVTAFARQWFSGEDLSDVESAVGEALANCAEHGHRNGTDIEVGCRFDNESLFIEIKDAGRGFDCWNATDSVQPLSNSPRGYGTYIMRRLMDEMEYSEHGTRLRLVKRLSFAQTADIDVREERTG